ncbi:Casein kinase I isoform alpha [Mycena venus]|uniref:Casein kinase I isoform alpha n=1 Tax=Mycena venus TaxID=2733690 RepID=A0A8H6XM94_9AGAR|nr:Casein kinase I isoform alpha [Mycena venus]
MSKSTAKYTLLPDADEDAALLQNVDHPDTPSDDDERTAVDDGEREDRQSFPPVVDPRFVQPTPSWWKRAALLFLILFCFWLAFQIKGHRATPKVVHANRYSKEFKYRPAASPIVTETLKDGRIRVRGAAPTTSATPAPIPTKTKKSKVGKKKGTGKGKKRSTKGKRGTGKK